MPTVEQRLATLEQYFADALSGGHPRWRAKHTNISELSEISKDIGSVESGGGVFGQLLQRHVEFGDGDTDGFATFDEQNRPFWRTTYSTDYWVLGLADHWQIWYDKDTGNAAVNGRCNQVDSIPADRLALDDFATAFLSNDYFETTTGFRLAADFAGGEWSGSNPVERWRVHEGNLYSIKTAGDYEDGVYIGAGALRLMSPYEADYTSLYNDPPNQYYTPLRMQSYLESAAVQEVALYHTHYGHVLLRSANADTEAADLEIASYTRDETISLSPSRISMSSLANEYWLNIGSRTLGNADTDFDLWGDEVRIGPYTSSTPYPMLGVGLDGFNFYGGDICWKVFTDGNVDRGLPGETTPEINVFRLRPDPETGKPRWSDGVTWHDLAYA